MHNYFCIKRKFSRGCVNGITFLRTSIRTFSEHERSHFICFEFVFCEYFENK